MNPILSFILVLALLFAALTRLQLSPMVAMLSAAILMAALCGFTPAQTLSCLTDGFGSAMSSIGLQIVFGGIFGLLLGQSGAMEELAKAILRRFGRKNDFLALNLASYCTFIPVFFDPAYMTLSPLAQGLQKYTGHSPRGYVTAVFMGLITSHCVIPPAAGPLAVAGTMGAGMGWLILYGFVAALPASLLCGWVYAKLTAKRIAGQTDGEALRTLLKRDPKKPPVGLTISLILLPVLLIVLKGLLRGLLPEDLALVKLLSFFGDSNIALFVAMLLAALLLRSYLPAPVWQFIDAAPRSFGGILILLGCGSSFAAVLQRSGVGEALIEQLSSFDMPLLLLAFLLTTLIRAAVGSGTVAMIATASIVAPTACAQGCPPVLAALAVCAGAITLTLPTDAAFWLPVKYQELSIGETLRAITVPSLAAGCLTFLMVLLLSLLSGVVPGL